LRLPLALALLGAISANAAELPSRSTKSGASVNAGRKAQACEIGGEQGLRLANGTCVRVSGYVSAGVSAGNVKH
jgi:hypothetical protein